MEKYFYVRGNNMQLTLKQKKEIVKYNIFQAKTIIFYAEKINKGRYVHDINRHITTIKNLLKEKDAKVFGSKIFLEICKNKESLAAILFMLEKMI